jgi:hypothetical protein
MVDTLNKVAVYVAWGPRQTANYVHCCNIRDFGQAVHWARGRLLLAVLHLHGQCPAAALPQAAGLHHPNLQHSVYVTAPLKPGDCFEVGGHRLTFWLRGAPPQMHLVAKMQNWQINCNSRNWFIFQL